MHRWLPLHREVHAAGTIRRGEQRARRLAIRVYPDARVEVVVPPRARPREVESFLAAQREWIEAKRAQALRNRPEPEVFPPPGLQLGLEALAARTAHSPST